MRGRSIYNYLVLISVAVFLVGIMVPLDAEAKPLKYQLKITSVNDPQHHVTKGVDKFCELVGKKSEGEIQIQNFHSSQLGSGLETFEACQAGFLEFAGDSFANLVTLTRAFEVLHMPYLFNTREQALRAIDSKEFHDRTDKILGEIGLKWIITIDYGFRKLGTNKKVVRVPTDLKGLMIRASRSPSEIAFLKHNGAAAVTIDWGEAYMALRSGAVDGVNIPFMEYYTAKTYEVVKNIIENHDNQWVAYVGVVNMKKWDSWPVEIKKVILEAAQDAQTWHRQIFNQEYDSALKGLKEKGTNVYTISPEEKKLWIEKGKEVWKEFEDVAPPSAIRMVQKAAGL